MCVRSTCLFVAAAMTIGVAIPWQPWGSPGCAPFSNLCLLLLRPNVCRSASRASRTNLPLCTPTWARETLQIHLQRLLRLTPRCVSLRLLMSGGFRRNGSKAQGALFSWPGWAWPWHPISQLKLSSPLCEEAEVAGKRCSTPPLRRGRLNSCEPYCDLAPQVNIGSYPNTQENPQGYKVRLQLQGRDRAAVEAAAEAIRLSFSTFT